MDVRVRQIEMIMFCAGDIVSVFNGSDYLRVYISPPCPLCIQCEKNNISVLSLASACLVSKILASSMRFQYMKTIPQLLFSAMLASATLSGQSSQDRWVIPEAAYSAAFRIEVMKSGEDCTIISYVPLEYNETMTPRDDRQLGVQYLVYGKDCQHHFAETFASLTGRDGEEFFPIPEKTLVLDSFEYINIVTTDEIIADGCTKIFVTSFWGDHHTATDPRDDVYLGTDMFVESADPGQINGPFDFTAIHQSVDDELELFSDIPGLLSIFNSHDYYKLKEMQVNKNYIVEQFRASGLLKDITPEMKVEKVKLKRVKMEN